MTISDIKTHHRLQPFLEPDRMITGKRHAKCREDEELFMKLQLRLPGEVEPEGGATPSVDQKQPRRHQSTQ